MSLQVGDYVYVTWYDLPDWEGYGKVISAGYYNTVKCQSNQIGTFRNEHLRKIDSIEQLEARLMGYI